MTKRVTHENETLCVTFANGDNMQFNVMRDGTAHCDNFTHKGNIIELNDILCSKFIITQFDRVLEACEQAASVQGVCNRLGIMYRESIRAAA